MALLKSVISALCIIYFAFSPLVISPASAQSSDDKIKIGLIEDLSFGERGQKVVQAFKDSLKSTWPNGTVNVGTKTYNLEIITYDAAGKEDVAATKARQAIDIDRVIILFSPHIACMDIANRSKVPLILTSTKSSLRLDKQDAATFFIWAPSVEDSGKQIGLAVKTFNEAIKHTSEPTSEKLISALRAVQVTSELDQIRFDKFGYNEGKAAYPFRPDAAGCTSSCGSTCPSNCGSTACTKSGANQCCSICGMPRPN